MSHLSNSVMSAYQFRLLLARRNAEAAVQDLKAQLEKPAEKPKDTKDAKQNKKRVSEKQAAKAGLPSSVRPNKRPKALKDKEREKEEKEAEAEPEDAEFLGASDVPSPPSGSEDPLPDSALFSDLLDEAEAVFEDGSSEIEQLMAPSDDENDDEDEDGDIFKEGFAVAEEKKETSGSGKGLPSKVQALIDQLDQALVSTFPPDLSECPAALIVTVYMYCRDRIVLKQQLC